ncbi:MAG: hypothetical protein RIT45_2795 [Pseudomonadota bacterium]|jgi:hypothetical protein
MSVVARRLPRAALACSLLATVSITTGCDQINSFVDDNKSKLNVPIETEQVAQIAFDLGAVSGAAAGQPSPAAVEEKLPLPPADIDLNKESQALADNKGLIKRLEITGIEVTPTENTATSALPAFEIRIGAFGETDITKTAKIATVPAIPAGSTAVVSAAIDAAGTDAAQTNLLALAFSQHVSATMKIAKGEKMPSGAAKLDIKMKLKATLNPVK